jgi:diguanylate cyclase (GGDEF)-like protein
MFKDVSDLASCEVLIVDDSELMRRLLVGCLQDTCKVVTVESAEEAIAYCQDEAPDLVLMDWVLEGMSGLEACQKMQATPALSEIPIIFVTSNANEESQLQCWEAGAVDFVPKPIVPKTLQNRVKTHLNYKIQADILRNYSFIDGLTGIYNRRFFDTEVERLLKQRHRVAHSLSMIMIDIDFFKKYNDHYGHLAGDDVLKQVADKLKEIVRRPLDSVCRYGGEEFVVLLPDTPLQGAKIIAKTLVRAIAGMKLEHSQSEHEVITISAGVASATKACASVESLMKSADDALYDAKDAGRNTYKCAD